MTHVIAPNCAKFDTEALAIETEIVSGVQALSKAIYMRCRGQPNLTWPEIEIIARQLVVHQTERFSDFEGNHQQVSVQRSIVRGIALIAAEAELGHLSWTRKVGKMAPVIENCANTSVVQTEDGFAFFMGRSIETATRNRCA